jgi:hypothetical protein
VVARASKRSSPSPNHSPEQRRAYTVHVALLPLAGYGFITLVVAPLVVLAYLGFAAALREADST